MFDELQRLCDVKELSALLRHYQCAGAADKQAWQDRLADMRDIEPRQLVKLHGELLAYGWLEQNTGAATSCYRITSAGIRALKQTHTREMQTV